MKAPDLIRASLRARPHDLNSLTAVLVHHGYSEHNSRDIVTAWLSILVASGEAIAQDCGGAQVFVANEQYHREPEPSEPKSANTVWRDAEAEHYRRNR